MAISWSEMNQAIKDATETIRVADNCITEMAALIRGKLQSAGVTHYSLCHLKKELKNYNMNTGQWKE